jgi:hypothetical protein
MIATKKWNELSPRQRQGLGLLGLLQILLLALAQWDLSQRTQDDLNGSKMLWRALVFINFIGPIAYFVFGRKR